MPTQTAIGPGQRWIAFEFAVEAGSFRLHHLAEDIGWDLSDVIRSSLLECVQLHFNPNYRPDPSNALIQQHAHYLRSWWRTHEDALNSLFSELETEGLAVGQVDDVDCLPLLDGAVVLLKVQALITIH